MRSFLAVLILLLCAPVLLADPTGDTRSVAKARALLQNVGGDADLDAAANDLSGLGLPALRAVESEVKSPGQVTVLAAARAALGDTQLGHWLVRVAGTAASIDTRNAAYGCVDSYGEADCLGALLDNLENDPSEGIAAREIDHPIQHDRSPITRPDPRLQDRSPMTRATPRY